MSDSELSSPRRETKKVRVHFQPKPSINVCLKFDRAELSGFCVRDLIVKCVAVLKEDYLLEVHQFVKGYSMFVADKSGKKKSGYPELDLD